METVIDLDIPDHESVLVLNGLSFYCECCSIVSCLNFGIILRDKAYITDNNSCFITLSILTFLFLIPLEPFLAGIMQRIFIND